MTEQIENLQEMLAMTTKEVNDFNILLRKR